MTRKLSVSLALALVICFATGSQASAAGAGNVSVTLRTPPLVAAPQGDANYEFTDTLTSSTMRLMHGTTELTRVTSVAGNTRVSASSAALQPGDRVEIYKPEIPAGPPAVAPTETYDIPILGVSGTAGATAVSGAAPAGAPARLHVGGGCNYEDEASLPVNAVGGSFTSPTRSLSAGADLALYVFNGAGDYTQYTTAVPGESPCFFANASPSREIPTLDPAAATPFSLNVGNLKESVATSSRLVWRRGAAVISDTTNLGDTSMYVDAATQPLPGDVLEVYRPQTAPTPSRSVTIPAVSATIDTAASLLAVDSPTTSGRVQIYAASGPLGENSTERSFLSLAAGRTLIDFNLPQSTERPLILGPNGRASVEWSSVDGAISYAFNAAAGDLVAPVVSAKFKSKLRLAKIKKSISIKVTSNEAATGTATLRIAKQLPTKKSPKRKPGKRTFTFASANLSLVAGSRTVKLKLSKSGRKALKQLRGAGKRMRPVKSTLTLQLKDGSGNATTVTHTIKLVVK